MNGDEIFRSLESITPENAMLIGIAVLAVVVIILVIWIIRISRKLRKVTNMVLAQFELTKRTRLDGTEGDLGMIGNMVPQNAKPAQIKPIMQNTGSNPAVSGPISPSQSAQIGMGAYEGQPYGAHAAQPDQAYGYNSIPPDVAAAINAHSQPIASSPLNSQPINVSQQLSPATSGAFDQLAADMEDFLKGYKRDTAAQSTGMFGRKKPTIPFGDERTDNDQLLEYTDEAMSVHFDPDSINLGNVAGYKDKRQQ